MTSFTPGFVRSVSDWTPAGFDGGTIITRLFVQNGENAPISPFDDSSSPYFLLAPAKTSAGAPCSICAVSASVPAKENENPTSGWAAVKSSPIFGKTFFREAAARTVSVTCEEPCFADELHPTAASASDSVPTIILRNLTPFLPPCSPSPKSP